MRPIGVNQYLMLRSIVRHGGRWYPGCGVVWSTRAASIRLCESLERRGLLERKEVRISHKYGPDFVETQWTTTEHGREMCAPLAGLAVAAFEKTMRRLAACAPANDA